MQKTKSNKTQILHRIRLGKFITDTPLEDSYINNEFRTVGDIVIP